MEITVGQQLGDYEILAFLGSGAMGSVYRARDRRLRRDVALKILHDDLAASQQVLRRFEREAHSASSLNHPNIVTVYEVGHVDDLHFIAMEFVSGKRLRELIREESMTLQEIVRIASGMAEGLAAAHVHGIVHRDLKPENVMISRDGFVKILDFGLAKPFRAPSDPPEDEDTLRLPTHHTGHGTIVGTPSYMSPEQVAGEELDHRSDQFSFGAILYEMIARRRPFDRATQVETMTAILRDTPPRISEVVDDVPPELVRLIGRLLSKPRDDRYGATDDLAHDVRDLRDQISLGIDRTPRPRVSPAVRSRGGILGAAVAALLLVLLGVYVWNGVDRRAETGAVPQALASAALPANKYLAVFPFDDLTGDPDALLYAQGMAETISIRLASLPGIQVIPPSAGGEVTGDLSTRAKSLGANLVLRGSVRRANDSLRINFHVIDPERGTQLAAGTVTGSMDDPFVMEDRLADSILHALELELGEQRRGASNQGILDAAAQDRYVQALGALQRYENESSVDLAVDLLEEIRADAPGSALVGAALGRAYLYKFQLTSDAEWADKAVETSESVIRLDPELSEVHVTFGEVLTKLGRFDEAILRFRQALDQRPDSAPAILGLAEALDRAGRDTEAKQMYEKAIAARPQYWAGYNKLGVFHYRRGQLEEAEKQFRKVVSLTPDNTRALNNLGGIYFSTGRFEMAAERFRESLDISETATGWSNLGTSLYYVGRFDDASRAFDRATSMAPENHLFWMNLGDALRWSDKRKAEANDAYRRAIKLSKNAIERDPGDALAHAVAAASHAKLGEHRLARELSSRAVALAPEDGEVLLAASITAHLAGHEEEAAELIGRALSAGARIEIIRREPELADLRRRGTIVIEELVRVHKSQEQNKEEP